MINLAYPVRKKQKVLGLGCGIGTFATEFSKLGVSVIGIDSLTEALKIARKLSLRYTQNKPKLLLADTTCLPFRENELDLIVCANLIEYLNHEDYLKLLEEAWGVLKPTEKLLIYTPCPTHLFEILKKQHNLKKRPNAH